MRHRHVINQRLTNARDPNATASPHVPGDVLRLVDGGYLRVEAVDDHDPSIVYGWLVASGYPGCFASVMRHEVAEHVACEWPRRRIPHPDHPSVQ